MHTEFPEHITTIRLGKRGKSPEEKVTTEFRLRKENTLHKDSKRKTTMIR